uniref:Glutathione peroxidase n=1 Tax=Panagrolaimus sp. PS1159 TaxID=55785 RepID=A0AC35F7J1_9BILA
MISAAPRLVSLNTAARAASASAGNRPKNIYEFTATDIDGNEVSMDRYKGNIVIITNVASKCQTTESNYLEFKALLDEYGPRGLKIAAFPSDQFLKEEPWDEQKIKEYVQTKYNFTGDLYSKIKVNGKEAHPLFKFLQHEQEGTLFDFIKWNFTKFLVNRNGEVVERYAPTKHPKKMAQDIEKLL